MYIIVDIVNFVNICLINLYINKLKLIEIQKLLLAQVLHYLKTQTKCLEAGCSKTVHDLLDEMSDDTLCLYIVACQRGGASNKPPGRRQDSGPGKRNELHI